MADTQWADFTVDQGIASLVDAAADKHRIPRNVLRAFVIAESYTGGRVQSGAHNTSGEDSVGLLQLNRSGGQGAGRSLAELRDPARNLAIGVPPIARAWAQYAELGMTRERVLQTAWHSGHPTEAIEVLDPGSRAHKIAIDGGNRIAGVWQTLEGVTPTVPSSQADGYRRVFDDASRMVRERPATAALGAAGVLLLVAVL